MRPRTSAARGREEAVVSLWPALSDEDAPRSCGAGKTFFLSLVRLIALEKKLVTANADLAPDRRLHASGGQARNLYAETVRNLSTRAKPDGGALASIVEHLRASLSDMRVSA